MDESEARADRRAILSAYEVALSDPVRLAGVLADATDDEDAVRRVREAFQLSPTQANAVLDQQLRLLHRAGRARVAEELRVLQAEWGPPLSGTLAFSGRRSAVLTVDGRERRFTAGGLEAVLGRVSAFLLEEVATPGLRPVVVAVSGLPGGPVRITVTPPGSASFEYDDAAPG